jgi:hypothetical protein
MAYPMFGHFMAHCRLCQWTPSMSFLIKKTNRDFCNAFISLFSGPSNCICCWQNVLNTWWFYAKRMQNERNNSCLKRKWKCIKLFSQMLFHLSLICLVGIEMSYSISHLFVLLVLRWDQCVINHCVCFTGHLKWHKDGIILSGRTALKSDYIGLLS